MTAAGWEALDRADQELYRGARLAAVLDWLERGHEPLTATERAFVEASNEEAQRVTHSQRRTNRRLRSLLVGVAALLVLALVGGLIALTQRQHARHAATAALAQSLGSQALIQPRPDLALLLAQQAVNLDPTPQTMGALFSTLIRASALIGSFPLDSSQARRDLGEPGRAQPRRTRQRRELGLLRHWNPSGLVSSCEYPAHSTVDARDLDGATSIRLHHWGSEPRSGTSQSSTRRTEALFAR